jgi:hypothetical protein
MNEPGAALGRVVMHAKRVTFGEGFIETYSLRGE